MCTSFYRSVEEFTVRSREIVVVVVLIYVSFKLIVIATLLDRVPSKKNVPQPFGPSYLKQYTFIPLVFTTTSEKGNRRLKRYSLSPTLFLSVQTISTLLANLPITHNS